MEEKPPVAEETVGEAPVVQAAPIVDDGEPKSYLAMMLLAFFAAPTGLARVYRGERSGWVRFWIYVVSYILTLVYIGALGVIVMTIWGVVDFFLLKKISTDVTGRPLHTTTRDNKVADVLFRIGIVCLALAAVGLITIILMFGFLFSTFQHGFDTHDNHYRSLNNSSLYN